MYNKRGRTDVVIGPYGDYFGMIGGRGMACDFVQNKECEYFPCHAGADPEEFSCLFCYCPLYALGETCGGKFIYTEQGIKDCSGCLRPHRRECYGDICEKLKLVVEMAKKQP